MILTAANYIVRATATLKKRIIISLFISIIYTLSLSINFSFFKNFSYIFVILLTILYSMPCRLYILVRNYIVINIISAVIFGFANYYFKRFDILPVIFSIIILYTVIRLLICAVNFKKYYRVIIYKNNNYVAVKALLDSGNLLVDPLTGKSVIIAEKKYLADLFDNIRLRHIHYKSLGNESGVFYAFDADYAIIDNHTIRKPVIAIYDSKLCDNNKYNAIISLKHLGG